ncbi:MAG: YgfZ/GcvT domain-containing protein [Candidatus Latescibacterota bacterium]
MSLKDLQVEAGAVFNEENGSLPPIHYGDSAFEYQAVKTGVGLVDRSGRGKLRITGKDRTRFLHGMVTNTVQGLSEWAGNHAALTTVHGQTLLDLWVHHLGEYLWLETEFGYQARLYDTLDRYLIADDVVMTDETQNWVILGVVGPLAGSNIKKVVGLVGDDLSEHHTVMGQWNELPIWVTRCSFLGEDGFDVRVSVGVGADLWRALVGAGAIPVGTLAQEVLRIEAGIPLCGIEIDEAVAPLEVGLEDTVDFNKGCYIGQEVIAKMHFRGKPRRYLVGVRLDREKLIAPNTEVVVDDKVVGRVTSCVHSMALNGVIALAVIKRGMHEVGQRVLVGEAEGEIVSLPFVEVKK